jgi:hypothetical protein
MTGDAKLKVLRSGGYTDMLRAYKIFINGEAIGSISRNGVLESEVPSGRLKIEARVDWGRSQPLVLDVAPGQTVTVEVSNHWGAWLALWAIIFDAQSYLEIKEAR